MAKYLVIVESPAKVKTIKKFLGKNYEVMASNGHVRDLPKSSLGIDVDGDFEPKYITIRGRVKYSLSFARRLRRPIRYISQPIPTVREKPSHGICFTHLNLRARMSAVSALMRSRRMLSRNH